MSNPLPAATAAAESTSRSRRCLSRCRQAGPYYAIAAVSLDVLLAIVAYLGDSVSFSSDHTGSASALGWTPHWPLALVWVRILWLAVLSFLAAFRGGSRRFLPWLDTAQLVLEEGFLYVVFGLLAVPCIVRLVSDPPVTVNDTDEPWFWAAVIVGVICTGAEGYLMPAIFAKVHSYLRSRLDARTPGSSNANLEGVLLVDNAAGVDGGNSASDAAGASSSGGARSSGQQKKDTDEKDKKKGPTIKKLLALVAQDWVLLIQACILLLAAAVMEALVPKCIGSVCSSIIRAEENGTLDQKPYIQPVVNLVLAGTGVGVFSSLRGATFIWIGSRVSARLRQELFDALASQEIGFFDTTKTGELTSRMTQDCQKVTDQVQLNVNVFLRTCVTLITTLFFMFTVSPNLTMVAFVSIPVIVVISKKYGKFMKKLSEATQKALAEANEVAEEGMSTMSTVRMFAAEKLESQRFAVKLDKYKSLVQQQARAYTGYLSLTLALPNYTTALVLCYGGKLAMHGELRSSDLLALVFYLQTLNSAFSTLGDFYSNMVQALGAATRVFELKEREPKLPLEPPSTQVVNLASQPDSSRGEIYLKDVHFFYPARPEVKVLKGLNLHVPAGATVALVGPSGNGKSTVIGLIKRLYKADQGQVTLDGIDVWSFGHQLFHRYLSIVGQEPVLYARTIRENITYGLENPKDVPGHAEALKVPTDDVHEAARTANAHNFITAMPEGYETEVGERGVQLSGGQKQRIAIARALVRHPRVLLLDEATSALDAESERQVQQAIDAMIVQGRMTVVIIAHRLSTVRNSHKICVISGGVVVEEGPHDELVSRRGAYFQLVESQLSGLSKESA